MPGLKRCSRLISLIGLFAIHSSLSPTLADAFVDQTEFCLGVADRLVEMTAGDDEAVPILLQATLMERLIAYAEQSGIMPEPESAWRSFGFDYASGADLNAVSATVKSCLAGSIDLDGIKNDEIAAPSVAGN